ncbi:MAG: DNA primase [Campylobacter sp.]
MIDPKSIERLKAQIDIVDVIASYVPLRKSGSNFVCVCPFHDDKNPSMSVSPSRGFFHCFSCKAGGDAIKFVMDYEKLTYPEAIEKVASLSNFTLNYIKNSYDAPKENKQILQNVNAYYRSLLPRTNEAMSYLKSRGVTDELINKFELGFAPDSSHTIRLLQNENVEMKEALEVGIVKQNENGIYASFINRITFPIHTHTGKIVGFGGRTISNNPAKYVNSPQSEIFDKSTLFYGYHLAKKEIFTKNQIIITEGYLDVIMLHKAGFTNAVAVLGTALTAKHLPLLKRGEIEVILCFDGDSAGINAAKKSALLLSQNEIDGSVVIIDGGADPADMVMAGKIEYLKQIFSSGTELGEFYIRQLVKEFDLTRPVQKQKALQSVQNYTTTLKPLIANSYIFVVADLLKIDPKSFWLSKASKAQNLPEYEILPIKATQEIKDSLEMQILKTMIEDDGLKDEILRALKPQFFTHHRDIFEAIVAPCEENESLLRELMLENHEILNTSEQINQAARILKKRFYENMLKQTSASNRADKLEVLDRLQKILRSL